MNSLNDIQSECEIHPALGLYRAVIRRTRFQENVIAASGLSRKDSGMKPRGIQIRKAVNSEWEARYVRHLTSGSQYHI